MIKSLKRRNKVPKKAAESSFFLFADHSLIRTQGLVVKESNNPNILNRKNSLIHSQPKRDSDSGSPNT